MAGLESVLKGLGQIKLKPSKIEKDASAPLFEGTLEREGLNGYHNTILDMNMEVWYDAIAETTFPTKFFTLKIEDAELLKACYETQILEKKPLSESQRNQLKTLELGLQALIEEVGGGGCVFVKTSCRSAKDTVVAQKRFKELYKKCLNAKTKKGENEKLISLLEAAIELLQTHNAKQLLESLTTSERIYQDMSVATSHKDRFNQHIAIRQWITVPPEMEFRGFYNNNKLNALSQYNHSCFYQKVFENQQLIIDRINQYFYEQVHPRLQKASINACIVDFAIVDDKLESIYVIELNPFVYTTDGCMFSWMHDKDVLENGPFEFRCATQERPGSLTAIADEWKKVVEEVDASQ